MGASASTNSREVTPGSLWFREDFEGRTRFLFVIQRTRVNLNGRPCYPLDETYWLCFRLDDRRDGGWKVYNVNVFTTYGAWLRIVG